MYCASCGKQIEESSAFCPHCGASNVSPTCQNTASPASNMATTYLYDRRANQERKRREADIAFQNVQKAEQELTRLRSRRTNCLVMSIILGLPCVLLAVPYLVDPQVSNPDSFYVGVLLFTFFGMAIPFGFMPIKDFITSHGFAIVSTAAILAVLFLLVMIFVVCAAIPYFCYLQSKIGAAKKEVEVFRGRAESLAAIAAKQ